MTAITAAATATANKNSNSNKTTAKATATASATASQQAFISIGWPLGTSVYDNNRINNVQLPWLAQWPFDRTPEIHVKAWVWKVSDSIQQNRKTDLTWEVVRSEPWDLSSFDNKDLGRLPMHLCPSRDRCIHFRKISEYWSSRCVQPAFLTFRENNDTIQWGKL